MNWFSSSRNLDICSLAVCSCVLTVLCHQTTVPISSSIAVTNTGIASSAPIARISEIDFTVKAGLFARSTQVKDSVQADE
ncbi:MAG TPA: hypothetical protein V6C65_36495 [Allocoleopsis sp.]